MDYDKAFMKAELKKDYSKFSEVVFGEQVAPFQKEWIDLIEKNKRVRILAPRGHAKTQCISIKYPLWKLIQNPELYIIIGSATASLSTKLTRTIKTHIERNAILKDMFDLVPITKDHWTDGAFIIKRKNISKDPSIIALGTEGAAIGNRADIIIWDDGLDIVNTATELQRNKVSEWYDNVLMNMLMPKDTSKVIVVGTSWHRDDKYFRLEKNQLYVSKTYTAILKDNIALWPEVWPIERLLEKQKEVGEIAWQRGFMNNPVNMEGNFLKAEWLQFTDIIPIDCYKVMGVDLAISESTHADYTAICTIAIDNNANIIVEGFVRGKQSFPDTVKLIKAMHQTVHPRAIAIEKTAYQRAMPQHLADTTTLPAIGVEATGSKLMRIQSLMPYIQSGKIKFKKDGALLDVFINEYLEYTGNDSHAHDDMLDALYFAASYALQFGAVNYDNCEAGTNDQVYKQYGGDNVWGSDGGANIW